MNRREVILAGAGLLASSFSVHGQNPARTRRVGILFPGPPGSSAGILEALTEGLRASGWRGGDNLQIDARYANLDMARLPALAAELASLQPDALVSSGPAPAMAFKKLGTPIPVVFALVADPVGLGLATSLGRPGGMFTGLATMAAGLFFAKQIELLREAVPRAKRLALLLNPDNPLQARWLQAQKPGAEKIQGLAPIPVQARTRQDLERAFAHAAKEKAEIMIVFGDPVFRENAELIAALALKHRLPTMFTFFQHVDAGGLMSYGIDMLDEYRRAATYVDKILKGAAPGDLPIEEPTKYALVINLKTARTLGLAIPQTVLLRAERVIE